MKILALSGGGVQGLYTAGVLARLDPVPPPDLITGTSIGAALGAARAMNKDMRFIEHRFAVGAPSIFPSLGVSYVEVEKFVAQARGAVRARYKQEPWRALLTEFFGDATVADVDIPLVIPVIEFCTGRIKLFTSWDENPVSLVDAILASSAAPTFFPIHEIDGIWYIDGGQAANGPDMVGLTQAMTVFGKTCDEISMLSIGTASSHPALEMAQSRDWGLAYWGVKDRMLRLSMAVSQNVHVQLAQQILGDRHMRLDAQPEAEQARHLALDGATPNAISTLRDLARGQVVDFPKGW